MLTVKKDEKQDKNLKFILPKAFDLFKNEPLWVLSEPDGKPRQINRKFAKCNDPKTLHSFPEVVKMCTDDILPAICLQRKARLIFIDMDHVRTRETGEILPWARDLIETTNSYTEISRSGKGLHIFLRGYVLKLDNNESLRFKASNVEGSNSDIEIYYEGKFATLTGDLFLDAPIREVSNEEMYSIYRRFFPLNTHTHCGSVAFKQSPSLKDDKILELARVSKNGDKFKDLYDRCDLDGTEDRSALDFSLANILAFFTQDREQIKRLMMGSRMYRRKWEREDYLYGTIDNALKGLKKTFQNNELQANPPGPIQIETATKVATAPFPLDSLPSVLKKMAKEIQEVSKTPLELCCAAVLSAASVATKGTVKVYEKENLVHFTCFFFVIIAESGERKSSVLKTAFSPIFQHQEQEKERYSEEIKTYQAFLKAAKHEEKEVLKSKTPKEEKAQIIARVQTDLEDYKPKPYRYITDNFTDPALFKLLEENKGSFAVMTLDGGNVLDYIRGRGHGTDGSLNDALLLKATWGDSISRDRVGNTAEGEHLFIKDPACHVTIVVQPDRCREFLFDSRLRGSGLIARILPIVCSSTIGTRIEAKDDPTYSEEVVAEYHQLISGLIKKESITEVCLDEDSECARIDFFNEIEREMALGHSLEDLRDIGSKITTQVTRLAALFKICSSPCNSHEIQIDQMTWFKAEAVGRWFLGQAADLQRTDYNELVFLTAKKISEKLFDSKFATDESKRVFTKRLFQQHFKRDLPAAYGKHFTDDILSTLVSHRWIVGINDSKPVQYTLNMTGRR